MKVKVYERNGNKSQHETLRVAAEFFGRVLLTIKEREGLRLLKLKRVHCPKAIGTDCGGESYNFGWGDWKENDDSTIKVEGGSVALEVRTNSHETRDELIVTVRNSGVEGYGTVNLVDQIEVLAHEMVHVAQKVSGRYLYLKGRSVTGDGSGNFKRLKGPVLTEWEGDRREGVHSGQTGDHPSFGPYRSQPWEVEAYGLQESLRDQFLSWVTDSEDEDSLWSGTDREQVTEVLGKDVRRKSSVDMKEEVNMNK